MLIDELKNYKIILASGSPRRQLLLESLDIDFEVYIQNDTDENYPEGLSGNDIPLYLARKKSESYSEKLNEDNILITADTIVYQDGAVLHKPKDEIDARMILQSLSKSSHAVFTGVCIRSLNKLRCFVSETEVIFDALSDQEINYYIQRYKPYDKAGAYGIQEWIGFVGVKELRGSYFNVMGLPVQKLYRELEEFIR